MCFDICFCVALSGVLDYTNSAKKKSCSVESAATSTILGIFLKICLFAWDIWVLCTLIERKNSEHACKICHLVKIYLISFDVEVFFCDICLPPGKMICSFLFLTYWQAGIYIGLVNRGVLLNKWMSWKVLNLFYVPDHLSF